MSELIPCENEDCGECEVIVVRMYRELRLADYKIFGDHAFAHAIFVLDRTPKGGGKTVSIPGKCTSFLRKQSNGWKHALMIFSYDQPST